MISTTLQSKEHKNKDEIVNFIVKVVKILGSEADVTSYADETRCADEEMFVKLVCQLHLTQSYQHVCQVNIDRQLYGYVANAICELRLNPLSCFCRLLLG